MFDVSGRDVRCREYVCRLCGGNVQRVGCERVHHVCSGDVCGDLGERGLYGLSGGSVLGGWVGGVSALPGEYVCSGGGKRDLYGVSEWNDGLARERDVCRDLWRWGNLQERASEECGL